MVQSEKYQLSGFAPSLALRIEPSKHKSALLRRRAAWLRQINPVQLLSLFDLMPGVRLFVKNRKSEMMYLGTAVCQAYLFSEDSEMVGLTDYDLAPPHMAQAYVKDDRWIYATGKPLLNRVELNFDDQGLPEWSVVNKIPIRSGNGRIIGIIGFSQSYEGRAKLLPAFQGISKVVSHIRVRYAENLSLRELGRLAGASERQLERKFKTYFGIGPQQYIIRTRLMAACRRLIVTDENLAEIAFTCGFSKPSAFAFYFRRELGLTPSEFRRRQVSGAAQA